MSSSSPTIYVRVKRTRQMGRPRGSKSRIPERYKASVKAVIEEVVAERKPSIKAAIIDGIESGPRNAHNYLRLAAEYTDGKPDATLNLRTQFREDEIQVATRDLQRKMESLFERASQATVLLPSGTE